MFDAVRVIEKPLAEQVADQISRMITERHLVQGEKLPNEFELAERLNVGRGTVREAVKLLVSRNILEIRRGKGTYVDDHPGVVRSPWGFAFIEDKYRLSLDLLEIRMILEPFIAEMAALRATEEDVSQIKRLCDEVESLIRDGIPHLEKDEEFHTSIANSTHNLVMPNIIPIINYSIGMSVEMTNYSLPKETIETHRKIANAIAERDSEGAKQAMILHLQYNRQWIEHLRQ